MLLTTLASGSKGNAYEIFDGETRILLECGLNPKQLRKAVNRKLTDYRAVIVTHEHGDHSKATGYLAGLGIPVYMSCGTADKLGIVEAVRLFPGHISKVDTITILPFKTVHDAAEPIGIVLKSTVTNEVLLFATDTAYLYNTFAGLTEIAIEANYDDDLIDSSGLSDGIKQRIKRSHMSLKTAMDTLSKNDLSKVKHIHLIHLSDANSNANEFARSVESMTGIETTIG